jgi:serine/threonine protein phosphatase PrpC
MLGVKNRKDRYPGLITAEPEILTYQLTQADQFVVLATHGVCDNIANQQIYETIRGHSYLQSMNRAARLCKEAISSNSDEKVPNNAMATVIDVRPFTSRLPH